MNIQHAYDQWAATYDTAPNKTRDLEAIALREMLKQENFGTIIEMGCGTGKNTAWLATRCKKLTAVDFSEEMMRIAAKKNEHEHVLFTCMDINEQWNFTSADLITCSLILEHIEDLDKIFRQASSTLKSGGLFYICELHPYKQLQGSCAKYENSGMEIMVPFFIHHLSDFVNIAILYGFNCTCLREWFDDGDEKHIPRLVSFIFEKK